MLPPQLSSHVYPVPRVPSAMKPVSIHALWNRILIPTLNNECV